MGGIDAHAGTKQESTNSGVRTPPMLSGYFGCFAYGSSIGALKLAPGPGFGVRMCGKGVRSSVLVDDAAVISTNDRSWRSLM